MNKESTEKLIINNQEIPYTIKKNKKIKRLSISIKRDLQIVVNLPPLVPKIFATKFINSNTSWIIKKLKYIQSKTTPVIIENPRQDYLQNKEKARKLIHTKLEHHNQYYNYNYSRVSIKNPKTRWGSCSSAGNLNFSYKIIYLPEPIIDYIIVHELCHLAEMNHSRNFWLLVAKTIPNHKTLRKELKNINLL